jgi:hypothetical protein
MMRILNAISEVLKFNVLNRYGYTTLNNGSRSEMMATEYSESIPVKLQQHEKRVYI